MKDNEKKQLKGKTKDALFFKTDNYKNFDELLEYMPEYADRVISVWEKLNSKDYKQQIDEDDFNKNILTNADYSAIYRCYRLNKMGLIFETGAKDWILKQNREKQEKIYENMRQCYTKSLLFKAKQANQKVGKQVINTNSINEQNEGQGIQ